MKKLTIILAAACIMCGCQHKEQSFQYNVDKFYDLEILRYDVPEFDQLTLEQKSLVYCLSEAALWGRDILFDQNGRYNLRIRRACEELYLNYPYEKNTEDFAAFERYLKRVWFSNGIHHHYSEDKFLPEFTQEWFESACEKAGVEYDSAILPVMFDPAVMPKRMTAQDGVVPAEKGYVLCNASAATSTTLTIGSEPVSISGNDLQGTLTGITFDDRGSYLVLGQGNTSNGIGFFTPADAMTSIGKNKAYLNASAVGSESAIVLNFEDVTTGISLTEINGENAPVYDLSGRRVLRTVKGGLYIQNGKKYIVK